MEQGSDQYILKRTPLWCGKLQVHLRLTSFKNGLKSAKFGNHDLAKVWGKIAQARTRVDSDTPWDTSSGKATLISGKTSCQKL